MARKGAQKHPRRLSIHKLIPNMITMGAMAAGLSAIKFAVDGRWEAATLAIVAATFMDAFDGAAARLLNAASKLGAELDSLSDFVAFGVAPALVVYLWSLHQLGRWGWFIALAYVMALALRLARFNLSKEEETDLEETSAPLRKYFTGVPSPVDAGLCILPLIVSFLLRDHGAALAADLDSPALTGPWMLLVALLAVSHMPTFSSKQIRIPYRLKVPVLAGIGLLIAGLINDPWLTLTLMGAVYLLALPAGVMHYRRKARAIAAGQKIADEDEEE